ncbi:hypothetical protein K1W54_29150 [Micromonospora sp. CPCC 205371]|nr:hypothetical protein [Micromonospora sp. CPCC 205371]
MQPRRRPPTTEDVLCGLVSLTAAGDPVAFAALYDALLGEVELIVRRQIADGAEAARVVRSVFVTVWRDAAVCESGTETVRRWVLRLAARQAAERICVGGAFRARYAVRDRVVERELAALLALAETPELAMPPGGLKSQTGDTPCPVLGSRGSSAYVAGEDQ